MISLFTTYFYRCFCLSILYLIVASSVNAQTISPYAPPSKYEFRGWTLGGYLEHLNIDSDIAQREGVGDNAIVLAFEGEYFFPQSFLSASTGVNVFLYDDDAEFTVTVENEFGRFRRRDSSAGAGGFYAEFGPKWFFNTDKHYLTVRAGYQTVFSSDRSIDFCTNCPTQDIDIDAGAYAIVGGGIKVSPKLYLALNLRHYLNGDFEQGIGLQLTWSHY